MSRRGPRRWTAPLAFGAAVLALAVGLYWVTGPGRPSPDLAAAAQPGDAPALGSCWRVDVEVLKQPMPWAASLAGHCGAPHNAEIFHIDRVDPALVVAAARARGPAAAEQVDRMATSARRSCTSLASRYVGGAWRAAKLRVHTSWLRPVETGYFGCTLVFTDDPAGQRLGRFRGNLLGALGGAGPAAWLAIGCVSGDRFIDCAAPHAWEFAGLYTVTPPGRTFAEAVVATGCAERVAGYVGASRADLQVRYAGPADRAEWPGSDQTFACYAVAPEGSLRGSVRGIGTGPLPRP